MGNGMMKAVQLTGKESLRIGEVPIPEIGPGEILLKVRAASICGTDVRMYKNGYKNVSEEHPLILGHEFSGDIAAVRKFLLITLDKKRLSHRTSAAVYVICASAAIRICAGTMLLSV